MWYKYIWWSIIIVLAASAQIFLVASQNIILANFNLLLIILVLLINLTSWNRVIWFLLMAGAIMDIYSSLPWGIFMASYLFTALILELLFKNFFTNRSFYSLLILGGIGVAVYNLFFLAFSGLLYYLGGSEYFTDWHYLTAIGWQLAEALIFLALAFWLINYLSQKFKPIFLRS